MFATSSNKFSIENLFLYKNNFIRPELKIYQCTCGCNTTYIGRTSQKFKVRTYQHTGKSRRTERPLLTTMHSFLEIMRKIKTKTSLVTK